MNFSKNQIKKAGKSARNQLIAGDKIDEADLEKVQSHRVSHQSALKKTFEILHDRCGKLNKENIVVYRLKRLDTILRKLVRQRTNQVTTMQDIAGCRAILRTEGQINQIIEFFVSSDQFDVIDQDNYIKSPAPSGYKSHHIIVKPKGEDKFVEIQLRTKPMHLWATLVEITDLIFDVKVKEGEDHPRLFRFHQLLSKEINDLTFKEKTEIVEIEKELDIVNRMVKVFKTNYIDSLLAWLDSMPAKPKWEGYLFMELDSSLKPSFEFFKMFYIAEERYFEKFTLNEPNMVLIRIKEADFNMVGLAYSNYVLTNHPSIRKYLEILVHYVQAKRKGKSKRLIDHYIYAGELMMNLADTFNEELDSMKSLIGSGKVNVEGKLNFLESWRDDTIERYKWIEAKRKELSHHRPYSKDIKSLVRRFLNWLNDR